MQQATINLPSSSPVRAMTGLAKVLALPAEFAPTRLPSYPALERTAVVGFNQPSKLNLVGGSDDVKVMLSRQAAFPVWASSAGTGLDIASTSYRSDNDSTGTGVYAEYDFTDKWCVLDGPSAAITDTLGRVGAAFGAAYPVGLDASLGPIPFAYQPLGLGAQWVLACGNGYTVPAGLTLTAKLYLQEWVSPGTTQPAFQTFTIAAGQTSSNFGTAMLINNDDVRWLRPRKLTISLSASGVLPEYFTFNLCTATSASTPAFTATPGTPGTVTAEGNARAFRPMCGAAEFDVSSVPYESTRVTACSLLVTNVTQVLNKNGTIIAGRLNPRTVNPFTVLSSGLMSLHPAEKAWLPMETGLYTYCPPSTDLVAFWDYAALQTDDLWQGTVAYPCYRLDNDSLVNVAYLQAGTASNMALTATTHLEFRTTSALFQVALSGYTLETLHVAQLALAAAGFFFENPEHKPVLQKIVAGIRKLEPFVTPAMEVLKMTPYGNAARMAYNVGRAVVKTAAGPPRKVPVRAGPQKVSTTSAAKSGIVVVTKKGKKKGKPKR